MWKLSEKTRKMFQIFFISYIWFWWIRYSGRVGQPEQTLHQALDALQWAVCSIDHLYSDTLQEGETSASLTSSEEDSKLDQDTRSDIVLRLDKTCKAKQSFFCHLYPVYHASSSVLFPPLPVFSLRNTPQSCTWRLMSFSVCICVRVGRDAHLDKRTVIDFVPTSSCEEAVLNRPLGKANISLPLIL